MPGSLGLVVMASAPRGYGPRAAPLGLFASAFAHHWYVSMDLFRVCGRKGYMRTMARDLRTWHGAVFRTGTRQVPARVQARRPRAYAAALERSMEGSVMAQSPRSYPLASSSRALDQAPWHALNYKLARLISRAPAIRPSSPHDTSSLVIWISSSLVI